MENACKGGGPGGHHGRCRSNPGGKGRGASSYRMQDPELVFRALDVPRGGTVLDIGCGAGDYAVHMAGLAGEAGVVHALDRSGEAIDGLIERAAFLGLDTIRCLRHDLAEPLPLPDGSVDICFMATALHVLNKEGCGEAVFKEAARVLRPDGRMAVLECHKEDQPWGPPLHQRLSPEQVQALAAPAGLAPQSLTNLGPTYLLILA